MKSVQATRCGPGGPPINLDMADVLAASTDLGEGACVGDWKTFDPRGEGETAEAAEERHGRAIEICQTCPVLAECGEWLAGLPKRQRPSGVVAGRYIPSIDDRRKKEAS